MHIKIPLALSGFLLFAAAAGAGPYTDDLSKCLVAATTPDDRIALARWIFIAFSAHPRVAPVSAVKPADVDSANAEIGDLFMKLLTNTCREGEKVMSRPDFSVE
jgi:hypothetical protein